LSKGTVASDDWLESGVEASCFAALITLPLKENTAIPS